MKTNVHVAGAGVISAIGASWSENWHALKNEQSGIAALTLFSSVYQDKLPVGEVKLNNEVLTDRLNSKPASRTALLALHAVTEALLHAGLGNVSTRKKYRTGIISGTTVGGMDLTEKFFPLFLEDNQQGKLRDVVNHACGKHTEYLADVLDIRHFCSTINTACSSSVNAIIYGARLIQANQLDIVIAGGVDALTKFTLNGFNSLMILDDQPCKPFDANRKGLNLGEGAGYVVLVADHVLQKENIKSLALVAGYGNTNDAFHQTASSPEGRGSFAAMKQAMQVAGLEPDQIDYINLHGTGTANNDLSESTAVKRLFDDTYLPPLSSTKAYTGHTLGASGGIEAVYSIMSLQEQAVFPNLRFETPIPETGIIPQQHFAIQQVNHVMSNSFGFGGNCSSIIFSKSHS